MPTAQSLGMGTIVFFCLGSCLFSAQARPLSAWLVTDNVYAQLVPGKPTLPSTATPPSRLRPRVLYREEVVLQNNGQRAKLRFYSDEDPLNPPLWFRAWEEQKPIHAFRDEAPEELALLGERGGHPVLHAWVIPMVFEARETKRIRIQAEYPVLPLPSHWKSDRFETYFSTGAGNRRTPNCSFASTLDL
ncbi:hypothetical protein [Verrucomicrobium sp. 3C]|uniref:hypothetical protein n=1 Tax=Verrucomicrobium sp. 3C TaxID=1134055 RepID=UPI00036B7BA3|nr:hypothetical protein [Verrucomicrobium sp. 3C]